MLFDDVEELTNKESISDVFNCISFACYLLACRDSILPYFLVERNGFRKSL